MIIKTKEAAQVFYDVEYFIDENKLSEETKEKLKELERKCNSQSQEYIDFVQEVVSKYSEDENAEQHDEVFGFEIDIVEDIEWEGK